MQRKEVDIKKVSPMMAQYLEIKEQYEDVILFFRLGDFYEMFFEDALTASKELELTLTGKNAGLDDRIPMCGVPHHAASIYLEKLISKGYKVAVCEQVEDPKDAKGVVKRSVVQIVTKGTIMSNELLDEKSNNYIASLIQTESNYILTYADITTGSLSATVTSKEQNKIISEILNLNIKEIIAQNDFDKVLLGVLKSIYQITITYFDNLDNENNYHNLLKDINNPFIIKGGVLLLNYLIQTQKRPLEHIRALKIKDYQAFLKMDYATRKNLELTENLKFKERSYSLFWLLDKCKTAMGSRMLKSFIINPVIDINVLNLRYDMVENILEDFFSKEELKELLNEIYDLERLTGRIAYGNANARDLLQLKNSLKVLPNIKVIMEKINFYRDIKTFEDLYNLIDNSIYENPPVTLKEGYLIKDGYHAELDELKDLRRGGKDFIAKFENEEKLRTGIKNLKVGFNKIFGYYIEISRGNLNLVLPEYGYERKQTLANCERFVTSLLKEKEALILGAEDKIINLEYEIFNTIKDQIKTYISDLQDTANVIAELDVLLSYALVSEENNYVRPIMNKEHIIDVTGARHPVVEKVLKNDYVPNDIKMDDKTNILLITGPNMAGKSTYMRQLAIIVIMAQIGCFIPAKKANLPVFDKIFTRIGASDDLVSGESTFMVEMIEANNAILNASKDSLILFDELGRGTATYDGMSLARAIIEYIHDNIECKTLFSTHYHELTSLEENYPNLKNIHVSANETEGQITFLHKIQDGAIDKSYGIHVAALANLPKSIINRANIILKSYEQKSHKGAIYYQPSLDLEVKENISDEEKDIINTMKEINPLEMTPLQALSKLMELHSKIKK